MAKAGVAVATVLLLAGGATAAPRCLGDCNSDQLVSISELISGVRIAQGGKPISSCPAFAGNGDGTVTIDALTIAVNNALHDCEDADGDGVQNDFDNCPEVRNADQAITAGNPLGDACMWPNQTAKTNSDPWLVQHHRELRLMRPRVLALNFVNARSNAQMVADMQTQVDAIREGSRYHGYEDPSAAAFLDYQVAYAVDLRDGGTSATSTRYPCENPREGAWGTDYEQLFSPAFAALYDIRDASGTPMDLCQLVNAGLVNEVWLYTQGTAPTCNAAESLEIKQRYTYDRTPIAGPLYRCAGNGCLDEEDVLPAHCTRSLRIAEYIPGNNQFTGHNLGHAMENSLMRDSAQDVLPYARAHLKRWSDTDFRDRFGLPFGNLYDIECNDGPPPGHCRGTWTFSDPHTVDWLHYGRCQGGTAGNLVCHSAADCPGGTCPAPLSGTIGYVPACGNIHNYPNREDDCSPSVSGCGFVAPFAVESTCVNYGRRNGRDGASPACWDSAASASLECDASEPWDLSVVPSYPAAPAFTLPNDRYYIWWRQNLPGASSGIVDRDGHMLLNVWPFLFY